MNPKVAVVAALKVSALAIVTVSTLHFTMGTPAANAETPQSSCFHYICQEEGTCTTFYVNHTCCFVEGDLGEPPVCHSESCLFGEKCSGEPTGPS
jgi:hypothetical protein